MRDAGKKNYLADHSAVNGEATKIWSCKGSRSEVSGKRIGELRYEQWAISSNKMHVRTKLDGIRTCCSRCHLQMSSGGSFPIMYGKQAHTHTPWSV